jgi:glycerophosphoryl diester phosphodiesterase
MAMPKDLLATINEILDILRRSFRPLILTSVFYRVIAFTILTPLISGHAGLFFAGSGRLVIANEEIAAFLLRPIGFFALLVITACSLTLIALEQACLMVLLIEVDTGTMNRVWRAVRHVLTRAIRILELAFRIVLRILFYSTPFVILAGLIYYTLLTEHDINYYLSIRPPEFKFAIIGGILLAVGLAVTLIRYTVRVIFSLPILLFEAKKPSEALRESSLKSKQHGLSISMNIGVWGVTVLIASGLSAAVFIWVGRLSAPFLLGHTAFLVPVIGLLFLGLTLCQFIVSIAATASFSALVMNLYGMLNPCETRLNCRQTEDTIYRHDRKPPVSGRVVIIGAVVSFFVATITGWFLLSRADIEDRTEIVAHRGASGSAPENTMAAIKQAITDGAHWVEIDVQRTADDRVVVVHDRDLVRIGNISLVVSQTPYARLDRIDVGSWFHPRFSDQRIPTLEAVLEQCRDKIKVNIELKYYAWDPLLAGRVIEIVENSHMETAVVVMSLKPEAVDQVKRKRPHWQVGLLAAAALTDLTRVDADFLAVHSRMVTPGFVRRVHRKGKTLQVWTINDTVGMTKMFGMGVDALITDEPSIAAQLLAQRAGMDPVERMLVTAGLLVVGDQEHVDPLTDGM